MKHGKLPECRAVLRLPPTHLAPSALPRTGVDRIVFGIAVGKAVEHDLVPDRIFRPIGSVKSIDAAHRLRHHRIAGDQDDRVESIMSIRLAFGVCRIGDPLPVDHELVGVARIFNLDARTAHAVAHALHGSYRRIPSIEIAREKHHRFGAFWLVGEGDSRMTHARGRELDRRRTRRLHRPRRTSVKNHRRKHHEDAESPHGSFILAAHVV